MSDAIVEPIESRFQRLARQPGGKPKEQALADAEKAVASLATMGLNLVRSNLELLRRAGEELAAGPQEPQPILGDAYGWVVEIAEVASIFKMTEVADVAMSFSELLFRMRESRQTPLESYRVHVEALRLAQAAGGDDQARRNAQVLAAHLKKVVDKLPDPDAALKQETSAD